MLKLAPSPAPAVRVNPARANLAPVNPWERWREACASMRARLEYRHQLEIDRLEAENAELRALLAALVRGQERAA